MKRRDVLAATASAVALLLLERLAADHLRADGTHLATIRSRTQVAAPRRRVWDELADLEGQTRWMHDAKQIRLLGAGPAGVGTRAEADVRILGIGLRDPVRITAWEPPARFEIEHLGRFRGRGTFRLEETAAGTTRVTWDETLLPPVLPTAVALLLRPILRRVFRADLERLARLAERAG